MTQDGWQVRLMDRLGRFMQAAEEAAGGEIAGDVGLVSDGSLWAVVWAVEDEVTVLVPPCEPHEADMALWQAWAKARKLRQAAGNN